MAAIGRPKRRAPSTPEAPVVQAVVQETPQYMDVPEGTVTNAAGEALSKEELEKLPLTKEEQDRISLQAAMARAAEIEENDDRSVSGGDKFAFDRRIIPAGWAYQWRTDTVLNQKDPSYQVELQKMGWRPVPATRHPEMMPAGWTADYIIRGGQILMEIPEAIEKRARIMEHQSPLL